MKKYHITSLLLIIICAAGGFLFTLLANLITAPEFSPGAGEAVLGGAILLLMIVTGVLLVIVEKLYHITETLQTVNAGQSARPVTVWRVSVLAPLTEAVNTLIDHHQEFQIAKDRLYDQIREVAAGEERKRLARDLHDSIKQQVFSISISAAAAEAHLDQNPVAAREALVDVKQSAREAMVEMRALLQQLAPAPLEKSGLIDALREQAQALSYRTGAHIKTAFGDLPADDRLPPGTQEALFRIAQEGFSNIARHARAQQVTLTLNTSDDHMLLHISDDGQGFDVTQAERGMGLNNIERRVRDIPGATVTIQSQPDTGTDLSITIPLIDPQHDEAARQARNETARSLAETAMRYYWGFSVSISAGILFLGLGLNLLIRDEAPVLMGGVLLLAGAMVPVMGWAIKRHRHVKAQMHTVSATYPAAHHLTLYTHQADWIIWAALLFLMPRLLIMAGAVPYLATLLGGVCLVAMSAHLGLTEWTRRMYLRALPADERHNALNRLSTELRSGWFVTLMMSLTIILPGTASGLYLLPENIGEWDSNVFIALIVMFVVYHAIMTGVYWRWTQQPQKKESV